MSKLHVLVHLLLVCFSEWVIVVLTPNEQFFNYSMLRASYIQCNDDDSHFVLDQHA
jgi:hypothetical protein